MKLIRFFLVIGILALINYCVNTDSDNKELSAKRKAVFYPPKKSPFKNNVGLCFSVEETNWFNDNSIKYNQQLKNKYTYERLVNITKTFKLIRIYSYLVAGWEQTGTLSPEGYAITKVIKNDKSVEALIGTSCNKQWFSDSNNVQAFVDTLQNQFGSSISQVKGILIGNEVNANNYLPTDIAVIMINFKKALRKNNLNIPVTVTFNNLPNQKGDTLSDNFVAHVMNNWDSNWNSNCPFVFIDPYPDAKGINNAAGVYRWQFGVTRYYKSIYPSLQIFIGETGGEGCGNDYQTTVVIDSLFSQLTIQYDSVKRTVPTFLFEAVNEPLKPSSPNQQYMGLFFDSSNPKVTTETLKANINLPKWFTKK